jgi:hypothetical protein
MVRSIDSDSCLQTPSRLTSETASRQSTNVKKRGSRVGVLISLQFSFLFMTPFCSRSWRSGDGALSGSDSSCEAYQATSRPAFRLSFIFIIIIIFCTFRSREVLILRVLRSPLLCIKALDNFIGCLCRLLCQPFVVIPLASNWITSCCSYVHYRIGF